MGKYRIRLDRRTECKWQSRKDRSLHIWRSSLLDIRRHEPAGRCPRAEVLEEPKRSGWALLCDGQPCPVRSVGEPAQGGHSTPSRPLRSKENRASREKLQCTKSRHGWRESTRVPGRRSEISGVGQNGEEFASFPPNPGVLMHEHMRSRSCVLHAELIW